MSRTNSTDFLPCLQQRSAAFLVTGYTVWQRVQGLTTAQSKEPAEHWGSSLERASQTKVGFYFESDPFICTKSHAWSCATHHCHAQCWTYIRTLSVLNPGGRGTRWRHFISSFQFIELSPCPISCFASLPLSVPVFFFLGPCFVKMIIFGRWLGM